MERKSSDIKQKIIQNTRLSQYISQYVPLTKKGANFLGLCPFHGEKTPSFTVNDDKNFFYCFGCQETGDILQFAIKYHHLPFREALEQVASYAGIPLDAREYSKLSKQEQFVSQFKKFLQDVALCYYKEGQIPENPGLQYLQGRKIQSSSILSFQLGFASSSQSFLSSKLPLSEYGEKILLASQLFFPAEGSEPSPPKDKFRNKVVFPIQNIKGEVLGFGFRTLQLGKLPKYINSSESPVFKKREILYGLYQAKEAIRSEKHIYVTEGYFDVIALHEKGIKNTVATLGTSVTSNHIEMLLSLTENVTFLFDGDQAGVKAAHKSLFLCLKKNISPKVILCEPDKDPYDMALIHDSKLGSWLKTQTQSWEQFFLGEIEREKSPVEQRKLSQKYLTELYSVSSFLGRAFENQIEQRFARSRSPFSTQGQPSRTTTSWQKRNSFHPIPLEEKTRQIELTFLCLCLFWENPAEKLQTTLSVSSAFFRSSEAKQLFEILSQTSSPFELESFLLHLPPSLRSQVQEEYEKHSTVVNREKALADCYHKLLISDLMEREKELKSEIEKAKPQEQDILTYIQALQVVSKKRKELEEKIKTS